MPDSSPLPPRVDWRFAFLCAALLTVVFTLQNWIGRTNLSLGASFVQQVSWNAVWLALLPAVLRSARRHALARPPTRRWVLAQVAIATGYSVVHALLSGTLRWALGVAVYDDLSDVIAANVLGNWGRNLTTYGLVVAAYQAVLYHRAVRDQDRRAAALELDLARAELETIAGRVRPHFLFNTLNAITSLVRTDPAKAETMLGQLSDLLRASLRSGVERKVRLDEELTLASQYLEIERTRFEDRLHVSIAVSDEARHALVPHLLLQPLVENAVRHGIAPREGPGAVSVRAGRHDRRLVVAVEDDGVGIGNAPPGREDGGVGLESVRSRLAYTYGADHRFDIGVAAPTGTRVTIEIPYEVAP